MMKPLINKPFGFSEFFNSKIGVGDASVCVNMYYHAHGGLLPVSCVPCPVSCPGELRTTTTTENLQVIQETTTMKIFHINEKTHRNQESPWHDRRIGEVVSRYLILGGEIKRGTVIKHISGRLFDAMQGTDSMMARIYFDGALVKRGLPFEF